MEKTDKKNLPYTFEQMEADFEKSLKQKPKKRQKRQKRQKRTKLSYELKFLYRRDDGICWICGKHVAPKDASRDHIVTIKDGGSDDVTNLKLAHKLCNVYRSGPPKDKNLFFYLPEVEPFLAKRED